MAAYFENGSPAMQQLAAIVDRLEQMVDHAGLANLFYALEHVCSAKARTNPTPHGTGWAWRTRWRRAHRRPTWSRWGASGPVYGTDNANAGTDIAQVFDTTFAIFSGWRLLIAY